MKAAIAETVTLITAVAIMTTRLLRTNCQKREVDRISIKFAPAKLCGKANGLASNSPLDLKPPNIVVTMGMMTMSDTRMQMVYLAISPKDTLRCTCVTGVKEVDAIYAAFVIAPSVSRRMAKR